jgi:SAM-dependent methyltransferase
MSRPNPVTETDRRYARALAAQSVARGDDTGWFERLYAAAEHGLMTVPWADLAPFPRLVSELGGRTGRGRRALVVGSGLGDDAEHVASLGYATVAFDVSATAITTARRRHPQSDVDYQVADLLAPPAIWYGAFDLVVEVFTLQVLTGAARQRAMDQLTRLVAPRGQLLVIARAREEHDPPGEMPWPLTRAELESLCHPKLDLRSIVDYVDDSPYGPVRRWAAWFTTPAETPDA